MERSMFCFQCEQTAGCGGCTGAAGVCGKTAETAACQDRLTGALIGLARAVADHGGGAAEDWRLMTEGLFATLTNVSFSADAIGALTDAVHARRDHYMHQCGGCAAPCGKAADYDMDLLWNAQEDIRSVKSLILFGARGMAAYACHAQALGSSDGDVNQFFARALFAVGEDWDLEALLPVALEVGKWNLRCMELLDRANTGAYGTPVPTRVSLTVEKGPFIVVSGHDLRDLELLLRQSQGTGVNVYTHGEMLPAHAYPLLKRYSHLKGNFGTAWQNQQREFAQLPAPVLFTTNCLMPPRPSYADRVFTTGLVTFPGAVHIGEDKNFTPVIQKALALGGYREDQTLNGINGGGAVTTGFGHGAVLSVAEQVVEAVRSGAIRHFFLVGGWVDKYPDMVKEIFARGHEIGNHSDTHPHMSQLSESAIKDELRIMSDKVEKLTGVRPTLFRPPYGDYNNRVVEVSRAEGYECVQWSIDSLDWKDRGTEDIIKQCTYRVDNGDIVLFHNDSNDIVNALPTVIKHYQGLGYTILPVSELLLDGEYTIDVQGKQHPKET